MVFCYQNCSDLLGSSDRENFLKFEAEGQEFAKVWRSLEKFIQTVIGQTNFQNRMLFLGIQTSAGKVRKYQVIKGTSQMTHDSLNM